MASTGTNKQPLLVDRVFHEVVDLAGAIVASGGGIDISGGNSAALVLDATQSDGCVIESIYSIARDSLYIYTIKLYMSSSNDFLRTGQGVYIGQFSTRPEGSNTSNTVAGEKATYRSKPEILAPVPHVGTSAVNFAIYVPKGKAIWAAIEAENGTDQGLSGPLIGLQGGWF